MVASHIHILGGHGGPLQGLFLHTLGWMIASDLSGGITGTSLRMKEVPAFMSTDALGQAAASRTEYDGPES